MHIKSRNGRRSRPGRGRFLWMGTILGGCCLLCLVLFAQIRTWERTAVAADVARYGDHGANLLKERVLRSSEVVYGIRAFFGAHPDPTRAEFQAFVSPALVRQPEVLALEWIPYVPDTRRAAMESRARAEGLAGFHFTQQGPAQGLFAAAQREDYFPVFYVEPRAGNERALGYDLGSSPERRQTLQIACDTNELRATQPVILAQEGGRNPNGILVVLPIYAGAAPDAVAGRRELLRGYALAVFRLSDLIDQCLMPLVQAGLRVQISDAELAAPIYQHDAAEGGPPRWLAPLHPPISHTDAQIPLEFGGRRWLLALTPAPAFVRGRYSWQSWGTLLAGILLTVFLGAYLLHGARHAEVIEAHVARRTRQLQQEIAERQRAERAARHSEMQYRSIFENAVAGIFQTSAAGTYLAANQALARMYGFESPAALISEWNDIAHDLYVDPSRRREFVDAIRATGRVADFESRIRRRDGTILWISENARAVHDAQGAFLYYEGTVVDITQRKVAEEALARAREALECRVAERTAELARANAELQTEAATRRQAEESAERANNAKTAFLAMMTHELRTPMNAILGYSQLMLRDQQLTPVQRRAVGTIQTAGAHLLKIINEALDLSKIESGRMELVPTDFELQAMLRGISAMFEDRAAQKGLSLQLETPTGKRLVRGDEGKLRQVLINLIGNALKFTDDGNIRLTVAEEAGNLFAFQVSDTGPGIPLEDQERIFEPFRQGPEGLTRGGTGLGLALARDFVALLAGAAGRPLAVASRPGEGSRFTFAVPLEILERAPEAVAHDDAGSPVAPDGGMWDRLAPEGEVFNAMLAAADTCSTTELKTLAARLPRDTPAQRLFRRALEDRIDTFDYQGLRHLIHAVVSRSQVER